MDFGKVFLGSTQPDHRRFVTSALAYLRTSGYERAVIPCCGQFTLVKAAIAAGFPRENISAGDISLFSSLLGYYYSGKPLSELPFTIKSPRLKAEYESCGTDTDRLALLILWIKLTQYRDIQFEQRFADDLIANADAHKAGMAATLETAREHYKGVVYRIEDLRDAARHDDPATVIVLNPPAYPKGYTKLFKGVESIIDYTWPVEEFNVRKEYRTFYESLKAIQSCVFVYRAGNIDGYPSEDAVFANERGPGRIDYWLCTKPETLAGFSHNRVVKFKPARSLKPYRKLHIFSDGDELTPESRVRFIVIKEEQALYYRDLWAHRLGDTKAEVYVICLLDEKVFAVVGFHGQALRLGMSTSVFESFGFGCPHSFYYNTTRLLMYFITTKEFGRWLHTHMSRRNRIYRMVGLKTTCLSKYRKVKLNNGILPVTHREKIIKGPNTDMYRIVYEVPWYDRTYADCIKLYLDEQKTKEADNGAQ